MYRNNLGDQIRDIVQDAMDSSNFRDLNSKIQQTVNGALDEVRKTVGPYQSPRRDQELYKDRNLKNRGYKDREFKGNEFAGNPFPKSSYLKRGKEYPDTYRNKEVGAISGLLFTIFGAIGLGLFGLASLICYVVAYFINFFSVLGPVSVGLGCLAAGSGIMLLVGRALRSRVKRYRMYLQLLDGRTYFSIPEVANYLGRKEKEIGKDLKKMIQVGMFPQGHIDAKNTCFMLDHHTYEQYKIAMKNYEIQQKERTEKKQGEAKKVERNAELYKAIQVGKDYISQIKAANDEIPGEEISRKLDRLEEVTSKIFVSVETHPEQLQEIRKFMEYYLPTTLKLVDAYREFDHQLLQGENVTSAKKEIEATLDTINIAFEKLLDGLYFDKTMEVSSDISVLQTLLAQEGLTKKDFDIS